MSVKRAGRLWFGLMWYCANFSFPPRVLGDLCDFAVNNGWKTLTAETQRTPRARREFQIGHSRLTTIVGRNPEAQIDASGV